MDGTCPWCQFDVRFLQEWGPYARDIPREGVTVFELRQCPRAECSHFVFRVGRGTNTGQTWTMGELIAQWPAVGSKPPHVAIPKQVADDWVEAHKCLGVGALKASAVMARRATQGICIDKNAKPGKLASQIKELVAAGHLHAQLGDWADQVRIFGNSGAHPGDDGLETVSGEDAEDALAFLDQLLDWTYVQDWKLKQSRARAGAPAAPAT